MSEDAVLAELKHMRADVAKVEQRMKRIEDAINLVAVQTQQINTLDRDMTKLWEIKDECARDMIEIKRFQASCPRGTIERDIQVIRENTREAVRNQWVAIGILFAGLLSIAGWVIIGG